MVKIFAGYIYNIYLCRVIKNLLIMKIRLEDPTAAELLEMLSENNEMDMFDLLLKAIYIKLERANDTLQLYEHYVIQLETLVDSAVYELETMQQETAPTAEDLADIHYELSRERCE
jgi:hypothetical protein